MISLKLHFLCLVVYRDKTLQNRGSSSGERGKNKAFDGETMGIQWKILQLGVPRSCLLIISTHLTIGISIINPAVFFLNVFNPVFGFLSFWKFKLFLEPLRTSAVALPNADTLPENCLLCWISNDQYVVSLFVTKLSGCYKIPFRKACQAYFKKIGGLRSARPPRCLRGQCWVLQSWLASSTSMHWDWSRANWLRPFEEFSHVWSLEFHQKMVKIHDFSLQIMNFANDMTTSSMA